MIAPVVLHIPHSSVIIPDGIRDSLLLSPTELHNELLWMTDWYTDELFALTEKEAISIHYPVSRLVVDPERFPDDSSEPMAARGMGAVYTSTSQGASLRNEPTPIQRSVLIEKFYTPHHTALENAVGLTLDCFGYCLLVDCHSFSSHPLPYELDQQPDRPDICLGTDNFHTPGWLLDSAINILQEHGFRVAINTPFSGALVPASYFNQSKSVIAIMIEINRRMYINELTSEKLPNFEFIATAVQDTVQKLTQTCHAKLFNNPLKLNDR